MKKYRRNFLAANSPVRGWYTCAHCGKKVRVNRKMHIDHIIPQSYGGWDSLDNLQCLCARCNCSKKNKLNDTLFDYLNNNFNRARRKLFDE